MSTRFPKPKVRAAFASLRRAVGALTPPIVTNAYHQRFFQTRFTGDYPDWAAALAQSTGYDSISIRNRVLAAARAARDGRAAYERDGVAFREPAYVWPVLGALMREGVKSGGDLRVVDFGGSLGSFYYQHHALCQVFRTLRWAIVEQTMFVEVGRQEFAGGPLSFHASLDEAVDTITPNVALFSAVLSWIEAPHQLLDDVVKRGFDAVIIDRTPVTDERVDRLTVQRVPRSLGGGSYPAWLLSRDGVLQHFRGRYDLRAEFAAVDPPVKPARFSGYYFERTTTSGRGTP